MVVVGFSNPNPWGGFLDSYLQICLWVVDVHSNVYLYVSCRCGRRLVAFCCMFAGLNACLQTGVCVRIRGFWHTSGGCVVCLSDCTHVDWDADVWLSTHTSGWFSNKVVQYVHLSCLQCFFHFGSFLNFVVVFLIHSLKDLSI